MVSVLPLIAVLLPWALSLVWKRRLMHDQRQSDESTHPTKISFCDWRIGDFAV
jgi:hypothetical protein